MFATITLSTLATYWPAILGGFGIILVLAIIAMISKFLKKAAPGQALVKTGFGIANPKISMGSSIVIPLLHKLETVDLTVKTIRIERRKKDSLSCADGIRAEVEVDFYIKINPVTEDIRHVSQTVGAKRATDIVKLRELFEAKFADALKTAGSKISFEQLYHNRQQFRDEIISALGSADGKDVVLNGYRLDDVAIQYLEQLPLDMHDENNVLDSRGRKEIALRTSTEAELANKRLREREVTIAEQDREAEIRQLEISQEIAEKQAAQEREIKEAQAREESATKQTIEEQQKLAEEARILKEKAVLEAEIERDKSTKVADEKKRQEIEVAERNREVIVAEAEKLKMKKLEELAAANAEKLRAEEQAITVKEMEIANRQKVTEVIDAEKKAAVEAEMEKVAYDVEAYQLEKLANARLEAAILDAESAEKQAMAITTVGLAEAEALRHKLESQNVINQKVILENALQKLMPMLPEILEKLMIPAEKIDSIKVLNINGMDKVGAMGGNGSNGNGSNPMGGIINTILGMGMAMPMLKEVMKTLKDSGNFSEISEAVKLFPGGQKLLDTLEEKEVATGLDLSNKKLPAKKVVEKPADN